MIHGAAPSSLRGWRTVSSELRWKSNAAGHLQQEGKKNLQQNIVCVIRWKRGDNDSSISSNNNKKNPYASKREQTNAWHACDPTSQQLHSLRLRCQ